MTLDTPSAVAASLCWLARWRGPGSEYAAAAGVRHPQRCEWCDYPPEQLIRWIEEFNEADLIPGLDYSLAASHRVGGPFMRQSLDRQREQVDAAQYTPEPA